MQHEQIISFKSVLSVGGYLTSGQVLYLVIMLPPQYLQFLKVFSRQGELKSSLMHKQTVTRHPKQS